MCFSNFVLIKDMKLNDLQKENCVKAKVLNLIVQVFFFFLFLMLISGLIEQQAIFLLIIWW